MIHKWRARRRGRDPLASKQKGRAAMGLGGHQQRSRGAAAAATFVLLLALVVVWFAKRVAGIDDGAVLSALVVIPALLYVILRGDLAEFRAPGGWAATFRATKTTVSFAAQSLDILQDPQFLTKGSLDDLERQIEALDRDQPVLMSITLGHSYSVKALREYLDKLVHLPRFRLIVFLDGTERFVGCASPAGLLALTRDEHLARDFLHAVALGSVNRMFQYPGMLKNVIPADATNLEALAAMGQYGMDALAVIDDNRHVKGVVEREQLMSKLVLSLAADATQVRR